MNVRIKTLIYTPLLLIHLMLFYMSKNKELILSDIKVYAKNYEYAKASNPTIQLLMLLTSLQSFRTQFLFRLGKLQRFVLIFRGLNCCDLGRGTRIGGGLDLRHGFGVAINSKATIGYNCTIFQNVTIGEVKGEVPVIGNNVFIGAGALVMGGYT